MISPIFWQNRWLIVSVTVIAGLSAFLFTKLQKTPSSQRFVYSATLEIAQVASFNADGRLRIQRVPNSSSDLDLFFQSLQLREAQDPNRNGRLRSYRIPDRGEGFVAIEIESDSLPHARLEGEAMLSATNEKLGTAPRRQWDYFSAELKRLDQIGKKSAEQESQYNRVKAVLDDGLIFPFRFLTPGLTEIGPAVAPVRSKEVGFVGALLGLFSSLLFVFLTKFEGERTALLRSHSHET